MVRQISHFRGPNLVVNARLQWIVVLRNAVLEFHDAYVKQQLLRRSGLRNLEFVDFCRDDFVNGTAGYQPCCSNQIA